MKELHANLIHAQEERNKGYKGRNAEEVLAEMDQILESSSSTSAMREKLLEGMSTPLSECIPENEVEW